MSRNLVDAVAAQRRYYTETAERYDSMHAHESDDDDWAFRLVCALLRMIGAQTVLDVGAGTGRAISRFHEEAPDLFVCGVEPVAALVDQATKREGKSKPRLIQGAGEALPFADASFDAVYAFGIMHHIRRPGFVVDEMLRVARKAVFIIDSNRFGQGPMPLRAFKLALYKTGLWPLANFLKTRGRGYAFTEGDGVAYSYSAFDSFDRVAKWADRTIAIPAQPVTAKTWLHPLLTAPGILLGGFKETGT
jgi:ubiquinone/menaquinone biosynthesis C-methylase UbiE